MNMELGILMLDTQSPRIPGDMGNEKSFTFPIRKKIVKGADPKRVIIDSDISLTKPFIEAARELEQEGVCAITTSCGFLAKFQKELADAVSVPVFTSPLLQARLVSEMLRPDEIVGIMTESAQMLGERHFCSVGIDNIPKVVYGMEHTDFGSVFVGNRPTLDADLAEHEMVSVAKKMVEEHPEVGALIFECTNMPPYSQAVQQAVHRPAYDIISLAEYVMLGMKTDVLA